MVQQSFLNRFGCVQVGHCIEKLATMDSTAAVVALDLHSGLDIRQYFQYTPANVI